ncbi:IS30 family transposase [Lacticaseibacillus paracasei]|uniref:IS30 family transposase n=1 Tax=Lacticaseibacillus paracasei TaxID=1597 RepID=A0ABD5D0R2_LACPA|nr:IS30 family transposase [Lacticaseibacillus paracasei]MDR7625281.1 IS30 family transposase [Lacticaseibacillus paracasei]WMX61828.1 IS30 family transposase [Lacticaseibacillus paracasei]
MQYIAATLGRSRISIRHELHRCPEGDYCAIIAQDQANACRHRCGRHSILTPRLKRMVTEKLNPGWSPEMVGYAVHCAPHTIYHWIYQRQVDFQPSQLFDHGKEFSCDQALTKRHRIPVYFCHASHPNERGTNERFNRELRYYFPKGTQFDQVPEANIQRATALINNKPRKCLRWQTPVQAVSKPLSRW